MSDTYNVESICALNALPLAPDSGKLYLIKGSNGSLGVFARKKSNQHLSTLYRKVRITGPREIYPTSGEYGQATYTIKNFNEFEEYEITISAGSVTRTGAVITVTPPQTPGDVYLTVNRESSLIRVRPHGVVTPEILYPSEGNQVVQESFYPILSGFNITSGVDTCTGVEFQVSPDGKFTSDLHVFTANGAIDRALATLPVGSYYVRGRYVSSTYGQSLWSEPMAFDVINNSTGYQEQASVKKFGDTATSDYGYAVSVSGVGEVILVCSPWSQQGKGSAGIYSMVAGSWMQTKELKAPVANVSDGFGKSGVVSADGNTIAIGAPGTNANDGVVHLFKKTAEGWVYDTTISSQNPSSLEAFGGSLSISADGLTLAVGADYASGTQSSSGAVYVFTKTGENWALKTKLCPTDLAHNDLFGHSVALSDSGTVLVAGAPYQANVQSFSGSAYIYELVSDTWTLRSKLIPEPEVESAMFGYRVAISADGSEVAATRLGVISTGGAVYFFHRSGNTWFQSQIVQPTDSEIGDAFGVSIDMDASGTRCVVGCTSRDSNQGKAYVLDKATTWSVGQTLTEPFSAVNNRFSRATAISANASFLIAATKGHDQETGTVYIYE